MTTRQQCRTLRRCGHSIGRIAAKLGLSESTVHWHVKDMQLTRQQCERLRLLKRDLMAKVNALRAGRPLRPVAFQRPRWSKELVHLVSHLNFDGRVDRYGCHYYSRSREEALHVQALLRRLMGVTAKLRQRSDNRIWVVSFYNVAVAAWLAEREAELLNMVGNRLSWKRSWLQAFFDDEGHIHVSGSTKRVRASQHDPAVLEQAQHFLAEIGIISRIDAAARAVEITGRRNLALFGQAINFAPSLSFNPERLNGLWRKPLGKRQLLEAVIASQGEGTLFQNSGR